MAKALINSAMFLKYLPTGWTLSSAVSGLVATAPTGQTTTITLNIYDQSRRHPQFDVLRFHVGHMTLRKRNRAVSPSGSLRTEISVTADEIEKYAEFIATWLLTGSRPAMPTPVSNSQGSSNFAYTWTAAAERNYDVLKALKGASGLYVIQAAKHAQAEVIDSSSILPYLNAGTSVWEQLYEVLVANFGASDTRCDLQNRTFVGDTTMDQLLNLQRLYLKKKGARELGKALSWSNAGSGPMTLYNQVKLKGSGLFVEASPS